jgi:Domain of unknown function (DUF4431)
MTKPWAAAVACAALLFAVTPSLAAECLTAGREGSARGYLVSRHFKDAAGRPESAYILELTEAACLKGSDVSDKVDHARAMHVYSTDKAMIKRIKRLIRKQVRVRGKPFGAITAHHHAPIVMELSDITAR